MAIATSNFMNGAYNGRFAPDLSVSMSKETMVIVRDHVSETRKWKVKLAKNICENEIWNLSKAIAKLVNGF